MRKLFFALMQQCFIRGANVLDRPVNHKSFPDTLLTFGRVKMEMRPVLNQLSQRAGQISGLPRRKQKFRLLDYLLNDACSAG
jgi:hypothetical protein